MHDAVEYRNGQKNNWRREVWNRIDELVDDKRRGPMLYLPGAPDADRAEATRRAFLRADMIAVERNAFLARELRARGVTTYSGTLNEALFCWPKERPISAVIADFQCGINDDVLDFAGLINTHPALRGAVVAVNLQRGRDDKRWSGDRCPKSFSTVLDILLRNSPEWKRVQRGYERLGDKNRALAFARIVAFGAVTGMADARELFCDVIHGAAEWRHAEWIGKRMVSMARDNSLRIRFLHPYKSTPSSPFMDSVVLKLQHSQRVYANTDMLVTSREISAALAIRTRRLRGELGGGARG